MLSCFRIPNIIILLTTQSYYVFQDGLRRRMDKLKSSIEEANLAVDKEREKNVSLLHMIFPPNIAKRLWLGKFFFLHHIIIFIR